MSSFRAVKSGLSRDTQDKIKAKYDPELATQCLNWITETITLSNNDEAIGNIDGSAEELYRLLKDGVILAKLANALSPGTIAVSKFERQPTLAFKQMELIALFINMVKEFGVPDTENFQTVDLFEQQNLHQVVVCLQALGRKAKARGLLGFGPKEAEANPRVFSEEQLTAGKHIIGLQMGTNKGASQVGMTFGKQRSIVD